MALPVIFGTAFGDFLLDGQDGDIPTAPGSPLGGFLVFGKHGFGSPFGHTQPASTGLATGVITMAAWPAQALDVGDTVTIAVIVRDAAGTPAVVDQMLASVTIAGEAQTLDVTPSTTTPGRYEVTFTATTAGTTVVAFLGYGGVLGAGQVYADTVQVIEVAGSFISVGQALAHLRAGGILTAHADREQLRWLCRVACQAIERDLGRTIARQTVVEEVEVSGGGAVVLTRGPVIALTSVAGDGAPVAAGTARVDQHGILRTRQAWPSTAWGTVTVTYVAGMDSVPPVLQKVALNAVQRMWQTSQNAPHPAFGDIGGGGGELAATAMMSALGHLTPVEYGAYQSYRAAVIA